MSAQVEICPTCGSRIPPGEFCAQCATYKRPPSTENWRLRAIRLVFSAILLAVLALLWYRYTHIYISHFR